MRVNRARLVVVLNNIMLGGAAVTQSGIGVLNNNTPLKRMERLAIWSSDCDRDW